MRGLLAFIRPSWAVSRSVCQSIQQERAERATGRPSNSAGRANKRSVQPAACSGMRARWRYISPGALGYKGETPLMRPCVPRRAREQTTCRAVVLRIVSKSRRSA
jgi:hypothetical protein